MEFCIGTTAKIDAVDLVKQAEDLGATHFGVGEGPLLFSDPYQYMALAARDTSTIKLGTWVTNPLTRIAPVTANSVATLNALAPGRTFLGIGTANNALRSMGNRPATMKELDSRADRHPRPARAASGSTHSWLKQETRDRVPRPQRAFGTTSPTRSRSGWPRAARRASRSRPQHADCRDLLPGPERRT